ncbi:MAG: glycoside hydrolase family 71/99-like protein [Fimbriimonas sp.]
MTTLSCAMLLAKGAKPAERLMLAHYMPWYASKPVSGEWGWHWTMGKLNPDRKTAGRQEGASHYRPLLGLYDSGDPRVIDCHVLLMKFAGIDGVMVDWYGNVDHYDYAINHRNTQRMFEAVKRAGLKFSLVYEDQTVPHLIKGGKFKAEDAVEQGRRLLQWVDRNWFRSSAYIKQDGRPVFLVFGPQYYQGKDWERIFEGIGPAFYSLHHRREPALGAYDWPLPKGGDEGSAKERAGFFERAKTVPSIPVAYPRFHDFYKEAGVHDSWGRIGDQDGRTYQKTLAEALQSDARIVQLATWNDWGEGTGIEPTEEFGYRDLEATQRLRRRHWGGKLPYTRDDLRLPVRLFRLQVRYAGNRGMEKKLAEVSRLLFANRLPDARRRLSALETE